MTSPTANVQNTPELSQEFQEMWVRRGEPFKRKNPFTPTLPVIIEGEVVYDLERMNLEYPGELYVTPVVHRSTLALATFVDAKEMLRKAQEVTGDDELRQLLRASALGCVADGDPVRLVLDCYDRQNLEGSKLRLDPEAMCPELYKLKRGNNFPPLNWDNAIRSVDACAYPYSVSSDPWFHGTTHFINFRCSFNATTFGYTASSIRNWGTLPPEF